ncbi:Putative membrane protein [Xenorhabdus bovienii]|uniref:Putative membrane protein n=1 Tax=Xenorhabdus bovienii TaxID=40576 RepID=A0A0B6X437_XENBV|nr:Putative membrane protein [Xenorhabdus bovienii]
MLLLFFMEALSIFFSLSDYIGFFRRDNFITFSWKSAGFIWFSPVLIYLGYILLRIILGKQNLLIEKLENIFHMCQ